MNSIYILGDPFEGEVCLCWEIPGDMPMSVPTLQQEKRRKLVHRFKSGKIKSFFACFCYFKVFDLPEKNMKIGEKNSLIRFLLGEKGSIKAENRREFAFPAILHFSLHYSHFHLQDFMTYEDVGQYSFQVLFVFTQHNTGISSHSC